jgi:AraC family transcriptional regulator, transcriptional activator FtrA
VPQAREGGRLGRVLDRMQVEPAAATTIAGLASAAGMSRRTFLRRFKSSTGTTPGAWLAGARLARARELLQSSGHAIEDVAVAAGFGSVGTMRHHFRRQLQISPTTYRRRFGAGP